MIYGIIHNILNVLNARIACGDTSMSKNIGKVFFNKPDHTLEVLSLVDQEDGEAGDSQGAQEEERDGEHGDEETENF